MKKITLLSLTFAFLTSFAQNAPLSITTGKTTSLIFPFPVKYVDRGSKDILVQQVKEADNILLVKAATTQLSESNLTVITCDGNLYAFSVNYEDNPFKLVWQIPVKGEANVSTYANSIIDNPPVIHGLRNASYEIFANVSGIYIRGETIYYQLQLKNRSAIDYDIDYLHFSIRDKKRIKRAATQVNELIPLYIAGNSRHVRANSNNTIVVAMNKFTIPDAKYLAVQIIEKNGGRHLLLRVHNNRIIKAISLPELR